MRIRLNYILKQKINKWNVNTVISSTGDKKITKVIQPVCYKKIFILELLPFVKDYARTEDENVQKEIQPLLIDVYTSLPFPVIHMPVLSPEER